MAHLSGTTPAQSLFRAIKNPRVSTRGLSRLSECRSPLSPLTPCENETFYRERPFSETCISAVLYGNKVAKPKSLLSTTYGTAKCENPENGSVLRESVKSRRIRGSAGLPVGDHSGVNGNVFLCRARPAEILLHPVLHQARPALLVRPQRQSA